METRLFFLNLCREPRRPILRFDPQHDVTIFGGVSRSKCPIPLPSKGKDEMDDVIQPSLDGTDLDGQAYPAVPAGLFSSAPNGACPGYFHWPPSNRSGQALRALDFRPFSRRLSDTNICCPEYRLVKMYYFARDMGACFRLYFAGSQPGSGAGGESAAFGF